MQVALESEEVPQGSVVVVQKEEEPAGSVAERQEAAPHQQSVRFAEEPAEAPSAVTAAPAATAEAEQEEEDYNEPFDSDCVASQEVKSLALEESPSHDVEAAAPGGVGITQHSVTSVVTGESYEEEFMSDEFEDTATSIKMEGSQRPQTETFEESVNSPVAGSPAAQSEGAEAAGTQGGHPHHSDPTSPSSMAESSYGDFEADTGGEESSGP